MRQLTEFGIPFSFEFFSYNSTKDESDGYKVVEKAMLRMGLRQDQSDKSHILIAYVNYKEDTNRFFYLPLLMKFNGIQIIP